MIEAAEIIERSAGGVGLAKCQSLALPDAHDFGDKAGQSKERLAEDRPVFLQ